MTYQNTNKKIQEHFNSKYKCSSITDVINFHKKQAELYSLRESYENFYEHAIGICSLEFQSETFHSFSDNWQGHHLRNHSRLTKLKNYLLKLRKKSEEQLKKLERGFPTYFPEGHINLDYSFGSVEKFLVSLLKEFAKADEEFYIRLGSNTGEIIFTLKNAKFCDFDIYFYPNYGDKKSRIEIRHREFKNRKSFLYENVNLDATVLDCVEAYKKHKELKYRTF
jgi:hypothetical protein